MGAEPQEQNNDELSLNEKPTKSYTTSDGYVLNVTDNVSEIVKEGTIEEFFNNHSLMELHTKIDTRKYFHNTRGPIVSHPKRSGGIYGINGYLLDQNNPKHKEVIDKIRAKETVTNTYDELLAENK